MCESDYLEILEEDERGEKVSLKKYCGEDEPAVYVSPKSKVIVHYVQTLNFAGTGWVLNFMGVSEGKVSLTSHFPHSSQLKIYLSTSLITSLVNVT